MMNMTANVRNRLQDGVINIRENRRRTEDFRQQQADIRRSRMTCSARLPSFQQTQDWTGSIGTCPGAKLGFIEEKKQKKPILSRDGIRWDAAMAALIVAAVLLTGILLADLAGIGTGSRMIGKLKDKIESVENRNDQLQQEIDLYYGSASVCAEAVKMDLISSNGARKIRLTAPIDARMTLSSATKAAENADLEGRMSSNAGD